MPESPYLSLIVPSYNEARNILGSLHDFQSYLDRQPFSYEIIVAADGNDGTRALIADYAKKDNRIQVLGSPERGGKGRGIRLGVGRARGRIIGFADADNKTPIEEIEKLLPWFDAGYDVIIGSRGMIDSNIEVPPKFYRWLGSRVFGIVMHLMIGLWSIHDTQCGFKFFRGDVARDIFRRQRIDGYMFDVEVLHLALRSRYRIKEVGVRWRDDGDSRLQLIAGNWRNLVDLLRIRLISYPSSALSSKKRVPESVAA